ncbi:hypothetical protein Acr_00g0063670 [Actinidia rufa]|uniref:Uncharacterized protein n=1 Tax=Actinidia rufa TaxID=165716 RepID=A0A7J0DPI4_9ERIC|nr:hypothetical protein Acr_00g0063670 [Actinidia rufa]
MAYFHHNLVLSGGDVIFQHPCHCGGSPLAPNSAHIATIANAKGPKLAKAYAAATAKHPNANILVKYSSIAHNAHDSQGDSASAACSHLAANHPDDDSFNPNHPDNNTNYSILLTTSI